MEYRCDGTPLTKREEKSRSPRLMDGVRGGLRLKHYSFRTEKEYLYWTRRYIRANEMTHPPSLGVHVEQFLTRLAVQELLGHKDVTTTQICTHVLDRGAGGVLSLLDR